MLTQRERINMSLNMVQPGLGSTKKELGAKDTAIGAGLDVANEMAFGTLRKIPYVKDKLRRYEALRPGLSKASKLAGIGASVATMGPVGRVGAGAVRAVAPALVRGARAYSKAHPILSNIGKGIGYGTAYNTGQQIGEGSPITLKRNVASSIPGSAVGGVVGHGLGRLAAGLSPVGKFNRFNREIGPANVASLKKGEDILSQVNPRTINRLKGDIFSDVSGKSRNQLERVRRNFENTQAKKLSGNITETLGKGGAPDYVARALRRTRPMVDKGYRDFHGLGYAKRAEDQLGEAVTSQPHFKSANAGVMRSTGGFEKTAHPDIYAHPHSTRNLDLTKRRLQEQMGHPNLPGDLRKAHGKTTGLLNDYLTERYEKYPDLMRMAQLKPKLGQAAQLGKEAFNIPSKDISRLESAFTKNNMVPELSKKYLETNLEKNAARKGAIDYLQDTIGHSRSKHGDVAWRNLANEDASKRLSTIFGAKKAAALGERAKASSQKVDNLNALIGGSQTAENIRSAAQAKKNLGILTTAAISPARATVKGALAAGNIVRNATQFSPSTKVGLMVNPRRYARYAKKLSKKSNPLGALEGLATKSLRHPKMQKMSWKALQRALGGRSDE
jgi:hypothetical protein